MWLARRTVAVIIAGETLPDPAFYLGRIVTAARSCFEKCMSMVFEEVTRLTYDDISCVRFNDRYSMFFVRHARGAPRH